MNETEHHPDTLYRAAKLPEGLRETISDCLPHSVICKQAVDFLPDTAGAYLLVLQLEQPTEFKRKDEIAHTFQPGWYVYAGTARGAGGIRARLSRHFKAGKCQHWHIDQLTTQPHTQLWACAGADYQECELVSRLESTGCFSSPCAGFGSSDCRKCCSHLLRWTH